MDIQTIAVTVAEAVQAAPERAQELIAHPREAVEAITGAGGFDVTEVVQATLARLEETGMDLSFVDLSQLDLAEIDVSKLDIAQLQGAADALHVDMSKLDMGAIASKLLGGGLGGLFGGLGGLFGGR